MQKKSFEQNKDRSLIECLIREKTAVLIFVIDGEVPFAKDLAGQGVKPLKVM
jgi:hypothetical protein